MVDHRKSFLVLRSERSGMNNGDTVLVLEESWLTNPKNDRSSVRLMGVGN